ncbi:hypothetical protein ASPACDRAFT_31552 [Aspergillus aculeatus ATCC 16872]|uniref:C2H2-type domain-containing protein n=1 Tax=Aspergillus aculeatus (strain ATCC 16872 / CBS 172.66 / WB 5094) TaxID=690307 RepID=A0A1L9WRC2_ASPA1|nr:uncharacterized protein ASPACDRAFT_31552 [Aspergillus aculeatus ATCC 16872]OJJ98557.1 hypothetical protein ASPACDRAFT_31552 [Aspergillus aculeatus ATCC 16872]
MAAKAAKQYQTINLDNHDDSEIKRAVLDRTKASYDRALATFDDFLELHPGASWPLDIRSYKGFMEFVSKNMPGRLGTHPTLETVESFRRNFEAGLLLRRDFKIQEHMSTTIKEWIRKDLRDLVPLSDAEMDKDSLSPNDLMVLLTQLWCRDFKEYRGTCPDRSRVQLSASLLLYCFTSARTGEVHESTARRELSRKQTSTVGQYEARALAACYKHFTLTIEMVDGMKMLVLTYSRQYVKGFWRRKHWQRPIHGFYELYREHTPLFFNLLVFFLPLASADRAFRDFESVSEILALAESIQSGDSEKILATIDFTPEVLDTPVFRPFNEQEIQKSTRRSRGADSFGKDFAELGNRAGYTRNVTARACRRWALMETDKHHSETARMKFAGHIQRDTFGRSYAHPVSEVDGPATYLGILTRHEHIQNRRSMGMHRIPQLWQSLPAKAEFEFLEREDVMSLDKKMDQLTQEMGDVREPTEKHRLQLEQHRIYNEKQILYKQELRRLQQTQRRGSITQQGSIFEQTLFSFTRKVMPERDLLAQLLPKNEGLRSATGLKVLAALETICSGSSTSIYGAGMQAIDGKCFCGSALSAPDNFSQSCIACCQWFSNPELWDSHCEAHLSRPHELSRCDLIIFRHAIAKAAYCPFCLGRTDLKPSQRMCQFLDRSKWSDHIESHLSSQVLCNRYHCRHPACSVALTNLHDLRHHLEDVHCILPLRGKKRKLE